jgi:Glycosyltransferase family 87
LFVAIVSLGTIALCLHTAFVKRPPNYRVVTEAARNILEGENPYGAELAIDWFKYSPLAGLLCAPFRVLPDGPGLFLFLLVQCVLFYWAFGRWSAASGYSLRHSPALLWIALASVALDLAVSIQNAQVNVAIWALMLLGGAQYAESRHLNSGLVLSLGTNLKLFPFTLGLCLLAGRNRVFWLSFLGGTVLWLLLPAALLGFGRNLEIHRQWHDLLYRDEGHEFDMLDLGSFLEIHFGIDAGVRTVLALSAGFVIGLTCLILFRRGEERRLHRFLVPVNGLYVLLFSYLSESPTSILATAGIFLIGARAHAGRARAGVYWILWSVALILVPALYSELAPPVLQSWSRALHVKTIGYLYVAAVLVVLFIESRSDREVHSRSRHHDRSVHPRTPLTGVKPNFD